MHTLDMLILSNFLKYKQKYPSMSLFFNSTVVDLQCVNFRCTAKWFSYTYIHAFFFFQILSPYRLLQNTEERSCHSSTENFKMGNNKTLQRLPTALRVKCKLLNTSNGSMMSAPATSPAPSRHCPLPHCGEVMLTSLYSWDSPGHSLWCPAPSQEP